MNVDCEDYAREQAVIDAAREVDELLTVYAPKRLAPEIQRLLDAVRVLDGGAS